jgi:exonuclease SbcC
LVPGEPCPVCDQTVTALPSLAAPADLAAADREVVAAQAALDVARRQAAGAQTAAELAAGRANDLGRELLTVTTDLVGAASLDELEDRRQRMTVVEGLVVQARAAARAARQRLTAAERVAAEQGGAEARGWAAFDAARDRLAKLDPPALERSDLADAWQLLAGWAATRTTMERAAALRLQQSAAAAQVEAAMVAGQLRELAGALAVELDPRRSVAAAVEAAIGRADGELAALRRAIAEAGEKREEQRLARREGEVARELWKQLHSDRFERWLLQQALARLAAGASRILEQLSRGQYGLALAADNNFDVVDHANADERRSARTLSGGETFLASLSLALALADDVAELATRGAARLDALFLDEGFGTLDQETLEVVEGTLATLGARGRMVGVVTHVRELAERLPVRFLVQKDVRGSTVERVEA